jgi:AsmA protein
MLEGVSGQAKQIAIGKVALDATMQQGARRTTAALAGPARANTEAQTFSLPQLSGQITLEDPSLPQKSLKLPVSGNVDLDAKKETVVARISTSAEESKLDARVNVAGFTKPKIGFDVNADKFNVDTWFPPHASAGQGAANAKGAAPASAKGESVAKSDSADAPIDLSALKSLNLNGEARVGQLQARGIKLGAVRAVVKAANGRLDVTPLTAQLYGGSMNASASAQANGNRIGLDANLTNVLIEPLLKDAANKDLLEGRGNVKLAVTAGGATVGGMKRALDGTAALALRDGAIKGINLAQKLRDAQSLLTVAGGGKPTTQQASATEKTDFSELNATFVIKNGVASNDDLDAKSPLLRLGGGGKIDIGAGRIDYVARVSIVGTLKGQDGRNLDQLRGVTVPVRLSGPFDQLAYGIDYSSVATEALKSRLADKLQQRLGVAPQQNAPQSGSTPDKPASSRDKAKDLLKGLLGR